MGILYAVHSMANQIERNLLWSERAAFPGTAPVLTPAGDKLPVMHGILHATVAAVPLWLLIVYFTH